jgi:hypothetical protein
VKRLTRQLLDRSQEAFILSLETYNSVSLKYRVEGFTFLFTNAWELLLKARILESTKKDTALFYPKSKAERRRTLSIKDCLKRAFHDENDPIRLNVEEIASIRDDAMHFVIEEFESIYSGVFQAGVLNYMATLHEWFDLSIADKCSPSMLTLVFDVKAADPIKIRRKYGSETLNYVQSQAERLRQAVEAIDDDRYSIRVQYQLVLRKSDKNADIILSSGVDGSASGILIEVPKEVNRTHPYLRKDIIPIVKRELGDTGFNTHDFQCVIHRERIKGRSEYHYRLNNPVIDIYSAKLATFIVEKIRQDADYLARARESYRRR